MASVEGGKENRSRRDLLGNIQAQVQQRWEDVKIFEANAPIEKDDRPKYFGNFPYPYMNGLLHLGHAFSLSKLEFASAYNRLCGKNVLFPQAFHCTGMPIKACADKLDRELKKYGCPPVFEVEEADVPEAPKTAAAAPVDEVKADPTKFSGKKSKAAAKQGAGASQWEILKKSGIDEEDIPLFRHSSHWLNYFPPRAMNDIKAMGCGVDWRRSFITTDVNKYYDSFIQWQFLTLRKSGKVVKDKRYAVFSPLDDQPCADHDRATGEGVGPQEYTLIKMEALELKGKLAALAGQGRVFLMAATLRPETMYGQTNCWILPEGKYGVFKGLKDELYVMTERSALNLSYQELTPLRGQPEKVLDVTGQDLIGLPVRSPHCPHERVYVLPLLTILTNKGTGVVTSVPSDSPDDYTALQDLKNKPKLRAKYGVEDEWVLPFEVIPIIDIPELGDKAAVTVCEEMKIQSQNDTAKLAAAKDKVYKLGFNEGVLKVGKHAGVRVSEAKPLVKAEMLEAGTALLYSEPEKSVMSRSGDECVVALTDQWYIIYGEEEWRKATEASLAQMETFNEDTRNSFKHCLGWLQQWACSRSFGLGTRLPWDPQYLIESLSDSTIYMAFYTIAHILQRGDMYGNLEGKYGIKPEDMTPAVYDAIFLGKEYSSEGEKGKVPQEAIAEMRREFEYWYPFDLRVSGKDLIQNHLTFALYNHTAIWAERPDLWPRAFRCNGHLLLNAEKMSKSTGNFKTLRDAIYEYGSDAMRWALADAGDGMDDANFETSIANAAILRLTKELAWIEETLAAVNNDSSSLRSGDELTLMADKVFDNEINIAIAQAKAAYDRMLFREALKVAGYNLYNARDVYRQSCGVDGMHGGLIKRFIEVQTKLLTPIIPHTAEHIWINLLKKAGNGEESSSSSNGNSFSILNSGFPQGAEPDYVMQRAAAYVEDLIPSLRKLIQKAETPIKKKGGAGNNNAAATPKVEQCDLIIATQFVGWQEKALLALQQNFNAETKVFTDKALAAATEAVMANDPAAAGMNEKQVKQMVMPFARFKMEEVAKAGPVALEVKLPFDERQLIFDNADYIKRSLKLSNLVVHFNTEATAVEALKAAGVKADVKDAFPGTPVVALSISAASQSS
uniref:leucine--tRNA ligase n=1 Tax=Polytomella parva TaxID=51329 RepID=A0A7S0UUZ6_9CHLO|mmetsp:Transcript_18784/g.34088  ORF Transcript_18784/g.34088 Transcript_18784/m.34088 type:complete len:1125 (+) Transcript_18784:167-3541(+)|eukprot:CAMPEP_0175062446 /NCGR_PEP_ID=MMETSP0052_2-20121109/14173_1 /TAXON_ID=51329 ORGANISM="Polytomella parva, Strain SAG 63-3" /NCGR_SAMPLE_ID=MMETSP0052_2 /ASSEMBLY_ACC=CAM_ASM_000194 /LENGTH=1124 /DNA_ID=CAMNT_0016328469 /DNA_START=160 /DNA_END=3534 /DNA_ORIENTATION=-